MIIIIDSIDYYYDVKNFFECFAVVAYHSIKSDKVIVSFFDSSFLGQFHQSKLPIKVKKNLSTNND